MRRFRYLMTLWGIDFRNYGGKRCEKIAEPEMQKL